MGKVEKIIKKAWKPNKKIPSKKVFKKSEMSVKINEYKAPSILGDENRFFKGQYEQEKRRMFFS